MTSKSPVRSCNDVDETALSFAEIKALCAGDQRIKERMDLDIDVSRLKLMKADYQSKKFKLEDNLLKYFPEQITRYDGFKKGLEADMKTLAAHPHPKDGFAGMEIKGTVITDKQEAENALLDAIRETKSIDPVQIGSYRGFTMSVQFSAFKNDLILSGKMTHRIESVEIRRNIDRIDNVLAQMPERLQSVETQISTLHQQQEAAKIEVTKPFQHEEELKIKSARLAELDAQLNIGGVEVPVADTTLAAKSERPSVLAALKQKPPQQKLKDRTTVKKTKHHQEER